MTLEEIEKEPWFGGQKERVEALVRERDALRDNLATAQAQVRSLTAELAQAKLEAQAVDGLRAKLEAGLAAAVREEREACARQLERLKYALTGGWNSISGAWNSALDDGAAAIRARGGQ